jgi:hypothetical protein
MYIDPNTGGMLFQVLAVLFGAVSGIILIFSGKIRQTIAQFRRSRRGDSADEPQPVEETQTPIE